MGCKQSRTKKENKLNRATHKRRDDELDNDAALCRSSSSFMLNVEGKDEDIFVPIPKKCQNKSESSPCSGSKRSGKQCPADSNNPTDSVRRSNSVNLLEMSKIIRKEKQEAVRRSNSLTLLEMSKVIRQEKEDSVPKSMSLREMSKIIRQEKAAQPRPPRLPKLNTKLIPGLNPPPVSLRQMSLELRKQDLLKKKHQVHTPIDFKDELIQSKSTLRLDRSDLSLTSFRSFSKAKLSTPSLTRAQPAQVKYTDFSKQIYAQAKKIRNQALATQGGERFVFEQKKVVVVVDDHVPSDGDSS